MKKVKDLLFVLRCNDWRYLLIKIILTDYEKHLLYLAFGTRIEYLDKFKITEKTIDHYYVSKDIHDYEILQRAFTKKI